MKPWIYSSQSERRVPKCEEAGPKTIVLPNQLTEDDNKVVFCEPASGTRWMMISSTSWLP